jgi:hypothetical protein
MQSVKGNCAGFLGQRLVMAMFFVSLLFGACANEEPDPRPIDNPTTTGD